MSDECIMCFPRSLIPCRSFASIRRLCYGACTLRIFRTQRGGAHGEACFQSEDHLSCRSDGGVRRVVFRVRRVRFVLAAAADRAGHAEEARTFAREMDAVAVHGQLPKHHQQFVQRLRVQKPCTARWWARASAGCSRRAATTTSGTRTSRPRSEQDIPTSFRDEGARGVQRRSFVTEYYGVARSTARIGSATCKRSKWTTAASMPRRAGRRARHHRPREGRLDARVGRRGNQHRDPLDQQQAAMRGNVIRDMAYFLLITVSSAWSSWW